MKRRKFLNGGFILASSLTLPIKLSSSNSINQKITPSYKNDDKDLVQVEVFAPSVVRLGEVFNIKIKMKCEPFFTEWVVRWEREGGAVNGPFNKSARGTLFMDNIVTDAKFNVKISGNIGFDGLHSYSFDEKQDQKYGKRAIRNLDGFSFNEPGFKYITVEDEQSGIKGLSNPIYVEEGYPSERLYWGDFHCHSIFGDGIRAPEELYLFARDEGFLDIFALTDHTEILSDGQWEYFKYVCNEFNEPYNFVTLNGGEWTDVSKEFGSRRFGHHNFIYPGNSGDILRSNDISSNNLNKLFSQTYINKGLLIANHTSSEGWGFDWSNNYNNDVLRLVELYNGGSYEMDSGPGHTFKSRKLKNPVEGQYAVDGLKKGLKLGFIGVGDTHDGRPGDHLHLLQNTPGYSDSLGPGLTGVWAEDLTRESVFEALYNRRVYATTNNRTWLKFSINGMPMGSEINASDNLKFSIISASNMKILNIELIGDGEIIKNIKPNSMEVIWDFEEKGTDFSSWYYVRLTLEHEHIACSSPIWIN